MTTPYADELGEGLHHGWVMNQPHLYARHGHFFESLIGDPKTYVVQTNAKVIERCVLMATDPGDLVLDPTCGSGTTAYVAEQWGRRWITIDTSRVALALGVSALLWLCAWWAL